VTWSNSRRKSPSHLVTPSPCHLVILPPHRVTLSFADWRSTLFAAAEQSEPLIKRLDPVSRTKVLMALTALLLLGGALIAIVMLWGRHARRKTREPFPPSRTNEEEWYNKPLVPKPRDDDEPE
jgi:hypothetical protein